MSGCTSGEDRDQNFRPVAYLERASFNQIEDDELFAHIFSTTHASM